jgi:hypothetical protein
MALALSLVRPAPCLGQEAVPSASGAAAGDALSQPAPSSAAGDLSSSAEGQGEKPFWTKVPPVQPYPRAGAFLILPTGPGYYSLRDLLEGNYRDKPPKFPYPPFCLNFGSFYDADFRFLDDPANTQFDCFDPIKRIHCGDDWLLSLGGEERIRYANEIDKRLTGRDNTYELYRTRLYADLWFRDVFRVYAEGIDARISNEDLPPTPVDRNYTDVLNLFADLKLGEVGGQPVYARVGRQEMYYGSWRLIAPGEWDNARRSFDGAKVFWHGDNLSFDAFWTRPVVIKPERLDSGDHNRQFAGLWTTYKPVKGQAIDLYYLYLDSKSPVPTRKVTDARGGYDVNTIGSRYSGDKDHVLWDFEGMYQFGDRTGRDTSAGAVSTGVGYQFADWPLSPIVWAYNDWASGDHSGGTRGDGTFNQLFGFGHYYFGFIDLVGRQNIDDVNFETYLFPAKWIVTGLQAHFFYLDSARDALYTPMGVAIRRDPTGRAGYHVGNEIDFTTNFHLSQHQDILVGYSHLFAGEFIKRTGYPGSPDFFYLQYAFKW